MRTNPRGFTLIELLIVISMIAIIASMALPNLLATRLSTNETAAIATLRSIASAQAASQTRAAVDEDADGYGEFLYLGELSGTAALRGTGAMLTPAAVSVSVGQVSNSVGNKGGYFYAVFLPDVAGAGVGEDANGGKGAGVVDPDYSETFWLAYAWPTTYGNSGRRAFVVNQSGNILQTNNAVNQYSGLANMPAPDAAFTDPGDITSDLSIGGVPAAAQDGGAWLPIN